MHIRVGADKSVDIFIDEQQPHKNAQPYGSAIIPHTITTQALNNPIRDYVMPQVLKNPKNLLDYNFLKNQAFRDWVTAILCGAFLSASILPNLNSEVEKFVGPISKPIQRNLPFQKPKSNTNSPSQSSGASVELQKVLNYADKTAKEGRLFNPGVEAQCAYWVRHAFESQGIFLPVSMNPMDGVQPTNPGVANGLSGKDIGQTITRIQDLKPGDLVFYANTYGNWPAGTITHVGIFAGFINGVPYMYDRGTGSAPVHHRPVWTNSFRGGTRIHPHLLVKKTTAFFPFSYSIVNSIG